MYTARAWRKDSKADMAMLMKAITHLVKTGTMGPDRMHYEVCSRVCDEFGLWETDGVKHPSDVTIPMWVMYLVSAVMREEGVGYDGE